VKLLKSQDAVHGFRQIENDLKTGAAFSQRVILLHGKEAYLTETYAKRLAERFVSNEAAFMDLISVGGDEAAADDVIAACDTLPMLSEKRVVILNNYPGDEKSLSSAGAKALATYIPKIPAETLLIITSAGFSKRSALYKAISASGGAYEFERLSQADLSSFINSRFKSARFAADESIIKEIIAASGYFDRESDCDLFRIAGDLKRIVAYASATPADTAAPDAGGKPDEGLRLRAGLPQIRHSDVAACMDTAPETDIFALLDAVSAGNKAEAIELATGITAKEESSFQILGLLTSQFELMLGCREMQEKAASYKDMMKTLGISSEFRLKKAAGFASRYSVPQLMKLLSRLYRVEQDIKSGLYNERLALTMFIAEMNYE
jgi:DNA polymerase-3 subunit delta